MVLSNQYQKDEIQKIANNTPVNFDIVRDVMYKYSKKAEDRYLCNICESFILYKFAQSEDGQNYVNNKLEKIDANETADKANERRNKQLSQIK
jgi:hypothetical protein